MMMTMVKMTMNEDDDDDGGDDDDDVVSQGNPRICSDTVVRPVT